MYAIAAANPERDGLRCFNHLYTQVTKTVLEWVNEGKFDDGEFLTVLDVAFANRYFDALRYWSTSRPKETPRVWRALLERRADDDVASIQFAVAGINAHINLDLAVALVRTHEILGVPLGTGTQRADYEKINDIFRDLYASLRDEYVDGVLEDIDQGRMELVIDAISHFAVDNARDASWRNAKFMLELRNRQLVSWFTESLDRTFGFAGRGLLVRVGHETRPLGLR